MAHFMGEEQSLGPPPGLHSLIVLMAPSSVVKLVFLTSVNSLLNPPTIVSGWLGWMDWVGVKDIITAAAAIVHVMLLWKQNNQTHINKQCYFFSSFVLQKKNNLKNFLTLSTKKQKYFLCVSSENLKKMLQFRFLHN